MADTKPHREHDDDRDPVSPESLEAGYEKKDTRTRPVLVTGLAITVIVLVVIALAYPFYNVLNRYAARQDQPASPLVAPGAAGRELPPTPNLQVSPRKDMDAYRAYEDARLASYGRDAKTGRIHIPIGKGIEKMLKKGYPVREGGPSPEAAGPDTMLPSVSSSGRMTEMRGK